MFLVVFCRKSKPELGEQQIRDLIPLLSPEGIDVLSQCLYNGLFTPQPLSPRKRKKLESLVKPHMNQLKKLSRPSTPVKYKLNTIIKGRGIISAIAAIAGNSYSVYA